MELSLPQRVFKNTVALLSAQLIAKLLNLVLLILSARILGTEGYGRYSFAFAFSGIFLIFSDMGINTLIIRDVARNREQASQIFGNCLVVKLFLSTLSVIIPIVIIQFLDYHFEVKLIVFLATIGLIFSSISQAYTALFRGFERMELEALVVIINVFLVTISGSTVLLLGFNVVVLMTTFVISNIISLLFSIFLCRKLTKPKFVFKKKILQRVLWQAISIGVAMVFVAILFRLDTIMLSFLRSDSEVGLYAVAYKFINVFVMIPTALMGAMFPNMAFSFQNSKETMRRLYENAYRVLMIVAFAMAIFITILSPTLIRLLFGGEFSEAELTLRILIWSVLFISINSILFNVLLSSDNQKVLAKATAAATLLNILLNMFLIPQLGHVGAAIATVLSEACIAGVCFSYISKRIIRIDLLKPLVACIGSCLLVFFTFLFLREADWLVNILILPGIYFGTLFLTGTITRADFYLTKRILGLS